MYVTIFKIVWPFLQRLLARQAAEYLEDRRQQRGKASEAEELTADCPPCPPADIPVAAETEVSSDDSIWFALSGILLGSAFSLMLYVMLQDDKPNLRP